MIGALDLLASPAGVVAIAAAMSWPVATGHPTWGALARGRPASTVAVSLGIGFAVFGFVQRLTTSPVM